MLGAWSIAGRQNLRTISMVSSDVRNCQMSKANPYDSFPSRKRLLHSNGSDRRYSRPDGLIRAQIYFGRRVRSWLRMNAGGAPNTCKSNGTPPRREASGERLSNTWRTCPLLGDSRGKPRVTPDDPGAAHAAPGKSPEGGDGSAAHQVDGGVTAHRADNG